MNEKKKEMTEDEKRQRKTEYKRVRNREVGKHEKNMNQSRGEGVTE